MLLSALKLVFLKDTTARISPQRCCVVDARKTLGLREHPMGEIVRKVVRRD